MRIKLFVTVLVVHPMNGHPTSGTVLKITHPKDGQRPLQPDRTGKPAVCQQTVISDRDPEHAKHEVPGNADDQSRPSEKPPDECKQSHQVN